MEKFLKYFAASLLSVFMYMIIHNYNKPKAKYTVYTAGHAYECNHFTISGKTIYFDDVEGNRVFISGDYSLVYEKKVSEE